MDAAPPSAATQFESEAENWAVPANGLSDGFDRERSFGGLRFWTTMDLDGDDRLDLVQTGDSAVSQRVWDAAGAPHWKVFLGGDDGWAATAVDWRVPPSGRADGFFATDVTGSGYEWFTLDMDDDGRADLVHTVDPATSRVWDAAGAPHWKVFAGTDDGFELQPRIWSVPPSGTTGGFRFTHSTSGIEKWTTLDLDGDDRIDLIQTADTSTGDVWDAAGAPYWKVFRGTTDGFAADAVQWRVPPSGLADGFSLAESRTTARRWALHDLDGDGRLDLVQTGDTSHDARVWDATGAPYWKLFANDGDGFAALARWNVPTSGTPNGFHDTVSAVGTLHWFLADADRDGHLDLLQTMNPSTGMVWDATGAPYWKVFRGTP